MTAGNGEREYKKKAGSLWLSAFVLYFFKIYRDFFAVCAYRADIVVMICICDAGNDDMQGKVSVFLFISVDPRKVRDFRCRGEIVPDILCKFKFNLFFHVVLLAFTAPSVTFRYPCCK